MHFLLAAQLITKLVTKHDIRLQYSIYLEQFTMSLTLCVRLSEFFWKVTLHMSLKALTLSLRH